MNDQAMQILIQMEARSAGLEEIVRFTQMFEKLEGVAAKDRRGLVALSQEIYRHNGAIGAATREYNKAKAAYDALRASKETGTRADARLVDAARAVTAAELRLNDARSRRAALEQKIEAQNTRIAASEKKLSNVIQVQSAKNIDHRNREARAAELAAGREYDARMRVIYGLDKQREANERYQRSALSLKRSFENREIDESQYRRYIRIAQQQSNVAASMLGQMFPATAGTAVDKFVGKWGGYAAALSFGVVVTERMIRGIRDLTRVTMSFVKAGADVIEQQNLFDVAFKKSAGSARDFAKEVTGATGLNVYHFQEAMGRWKLTLDSMGMDDKTGERMAKTMSMLAIDISSLRNIPNIADVEEKLFSGLAGQVRPMAALGIDLHKATVEAYALTHGLMSVGGELEGVNLYMARMGAMIEGARKDIGDFARTQFTPANQMKVINEQWSLLKSNIGMAIIKSEQFADSLQGIKLLLVGLNAVFGRGGSSGIQAGVDAMIAGVSRGLNSGPIGVIAASKSLYDSVRDEIARQTYKKQYGRFPDERMVTQSDAEWRKKFEEQAGYSLPQTMTREKFNALSGEISAEHARILELTNKTKETTEGTKEWVAAETQLADAYNLVALLFEQIGNTKESLKSKGQALDILAKIKSTNSDGVKKAAQDAYQEQSRLLDIAKGVSEIGNAFADPETIASYAMAYNAVLGVADAYVKAAEAVGGDTEARQASMKVKKDLLAIDEKIVALQERQAKFDKASTEIFATNLQIIANAAPTLENLFGSISATGLFDGESGIFGNAVGLGREAKESAKSFGAQLGSVFEKDPVVVSWNFDPKQLKDPKTKETLEEEWDNLGVEIERMWSRTFERGVLSAFRRGDMKKVATEWFDSLFDVVGAKMTSRLYKNLFGTSSYTDKNGKFVEGQKGLLGFTGIGDLWKGMNKLQQGVVGLGAGIYAYGQQSGDRTAGALGGAMSGAMIGWKAGAMAGGISALASAIIGSVIGGAIGYFSTTAQKDIDWHIIFSSSKISDSFTSVIDVTKISQETENQMSAQLVERYNELTRKFMKLLKLMNVSWTGAPEISFNYSGSTMDWNTFWNQMLNSMIGDSSKFKTMPSQFWDKYQPQITTGLSGLGVSQGRINQLVNQMKNAPDFDKAFEKLLDFVTALVALNKTLDSIAPGAVDKWAEEIMRGPAATWKAGIDDTMNQLTELGRGLENMAIEDQVTAANEAIDLVNRAIESNKQLLGQFLQYQKQVHQQYTDLLEDQEMKQAQKKGGSAYQDLLTSKFLEAVNAQVSTGNSADLDELQENTEAAFKYGQALLALADAMEQLIPQFEALSQEMIDLATDIAWAVDKAVAESSRDSYTNWVVGWNRALSEIAELEGGKREKESPEDYLARMQTLTQTVTDQYQANMEFLQALLQAQKSINDAFKQRFKQWGLADELATVGDNPFDQSDYYISKMAETYGKMFLPENQNPETMQELSDDMLTFADGLRATRDALKALLPQFDEMLETFKDLETTIGKTVNERLSELNESAGDTFRRTFDDSISKIGELRSGLEGLAPDKYLERMGEINEQALLANDALDQFVQAIAEARQAATDTYNSTVESWDIGEMRKRAGENPGVEEGQYYVDQMYDLIEQMRNSDSPEETQRLFNQFMSYGNNLYGMENLKVNYNGQIISVYDWLKQMSSEGQGVYDNKMEEYEDEAERKRQELLTAIDGLTTAITEEKTTVENKITEIDNWLGPFLDNVLQTINSTFDTKIDEVRGANYALAAIMNENGIAISTAQQKLQKAIDDIRILVETDLYMTVLSVDSVVEYWKVQIGIANAILYNELMYFKNALAMATGNTSSNDVELDERGLPVGTPTNLPDTIPADVLAIIQGLFNSGVFGSNPMIKGGDVITPWMYNFLKNYGLWDMIFGGTYGGTEKPPDKPIGDGGGAGGYGYDGGSSTFTDATDAALKSLQSVTEAAEHLKKIVEGIGGSVVVTVVTPAGSDTIVEGNDYLARVIERDASRLNA